MEMKRLTKIELVFENLEELSIPVKDISYFEAQNIKETLRMQNISQEEDQYMVKYRTAEKVMLMIKNKQEYDRVFEHHDITQIHLYDELGNHEGFYVEYDECDWGNKNQSTLSEDDEIIIKIVKTTVQKVRIDLIC